MMHVVVPQLNKRPRAYSRVVSYGMMSITADVRLKAKKRNAKLSERLSKRFMIGLCHSYHLFVGPLIMCLKDSNGHFSY